MWLAFQPIVDYPRHTIFAHEALSAPVSLRSRTRPSSSRPPIGSGGYTTSGAGFDGNLAEILAWTPPDVVVFANLHPLDLADHDLYGAGAPLSSQARRVVLEVTERSSLHQVKDLRDRIRALRELSYRIAVDDLGAGYAGTLRSPSSSRRS